MVEKKALTGHRSNHCHWLVEGGARSANHKERRERHKQGRRGRLRGGGGAVRGRKREIYELSHEHVGPHVR